MKIFRFFISILLIFMLAVPVFATDAIYPTLTTADVRENEDIAEILELNKDNLNSTLSYQLLQKLLSASFSNLPDNSLYTSDEASDASREALAMQIMFCLQNNGYQIQYSFDDIYFYDTNDFILGGYESARSLHRMGIMTADIENNFYPQSSISLAETQQIFLRIRNYIDNTDSILSQVPASSMNSSEAVDNSWFDDVAFIGHSQVVGMQQNFDLEGCDYYAVVGHMVTDVLNYSYYDLPEGGQGTLSDALQQKTYGKIYVMLGINDCPEYANVDEKFVNPMRQLLDMILEYQPDAQLYIISLSPVGQWTSYNEWFCPKNAILYCQKLKMLSRQYDCNYIDIYSFMSDSEGYFKEEYNSGDGIHINQNAYPELEEYLKTHT